MTKIALLDKFQPKADQKGIKSQVSLKRAFPLHRVKNALNTNKIIAPERCRNA